MAQQTKLDSLMQVKGLPDTANIREIINIGISLQKQLPDSAIFYYTSANELAHKNRRVSPKFKELEAETYRFIGNSYWRLGKNDLAVKNINHAVEIYTELKNPTRKADNINAIGVIFASQGKYTEAKEYFQKAFVVGQETNDKQIIAKAYNNLGLVYWNVGIYDKAIESFHLALELNQELGNRPIMGGNYNNIGNIHKQQGNLEKALEYYTKSLEIAIELDSKLQIAGCYNNIGVVIVDMCRDPKKYASLNYSYDTSIEYYNKALSLSQEIMDSRVISMTYNNIGSALADKGRNAENFTDKLLFFSSAIDNYYKSISIKEKLGDKSGMAINNENISQLLLEQADLYKKGEWERKHLLSKALEHVTKSMALALEIGSISRQNESAKAMMKIHKALGNTVSALEYAEMYLGTRDSLFSKEKTEALAEMETRYQTQQKEQEIEKQRILLEKHEFSRKVLIAGIILGFALAIAIGVGYMIKRRSNQLINFKNRELEQANAEISAQRDEIEAQRDMVVSQRDKLEKINTNMTNSLRYAQSIQAAILPSEKLLSEISSDYFVYMKPCELVSGDFFWATAFDNFRIFCVADCTGHGVPGAFMSILGITALNEIVNNHRVTSANEVLGYLRASVIDTLSQNDPDHLHKDGLDIGLCIFNTKTRELQFAGARIPLWLVFKDFDSIQQFIPNPDDCITNNGHILTEIKGDIMPVGLSPKMEPFTNNTLIVGGDYTCIYLATDGFADQFGQKERTKYSSKRLKNLIINNVNKPFNQQEHIIDNAFEGWKGMEYQIDDVTILGIKL